jgi:ketosteroid isomerase-like protein
MRKHRRVPFHAWHIFPNPRNILILKISTLLSVTAICSSLLAQNSKQSSDEMAIRNADKQWSQAIAEKDIDKTISFYGHNASVLPFNAPLAAGQDQIRDMWAHLFQSPGFHLQFAPTKIEFAKSNDMAYEIGTFELKMNGSDGKPATTQGKYVVVWKREAGQWKAAADIFNTDK